MAFTYTVDERTGIWGTRKVCWGTFTNGAGDYGGDIVTPLNKVEWCWLTVKATTCAGTMPTVNETFPLAGGTISIKSEANQDGYWVAGGT
jgi:hypothetical protein